MNKVRKNKSVWGSRITNETSYNFKKFGASIDIDKRLFREDIEASIVHCLSRATMFVPRAAEQKSKTIAFWSQLISSE